LLGDLVQTVGRGDRRDRGGRYEGVVRCGGRGGRGEVGEVPESEGIGRRGGGRRKERRGRTRSEEEVRGEDDDARKGGMKEERRGVQWNNLWGVRRTDSLASAYQFAE